MERIEPLLTGDGDAPSTRIPGSEDDRTSSDPEELWSEFLSDLPAKLRETASSMPYVLGLSPTPNIRWCQVFNHEPTLSLPLMAAEGMPGVPTHSLRLAAIAHLFAVIGAFARDRIDDRQVQSTPEIEAVLEQLEEARDRALDRLALGEHVGHLRFAEARRRTHAATLKEQQILHGGKATFAEYLAVAQAKQALVFPATMALAIAASMPLSGRRRLQRLLLDISVGLQLHDDVVDWDDDLQRGGSWVVAMAQMAEPSFPCLSTPEQARPFVRKSDLLPNMLRAAGRRFSSARDSAMHLGMIRLGAWADRQRATVQATEEHERAHPGFLDRQRALAPWARAVLT